MRERGIGSGAPRAGPCFREADEAEALEGGAAGGWRIDDQVWNVHCSGMPCAGGDNGAIVSAAAVGGGRAAAVEAAEVAVGMGEETANADGGGVVGGEVGLVMRRARAQGFGELVGGDL